MKYKIEDNFLSEKHYHDLLNLITRLDPSLTEKSTYNFDDQELPNRDSTLGLARELETVYRDKAIDILRSLAPEKEILVDYVKFALQSTPKNYEYPTHLDGPAKVLSGVIYLAPKISTGTFLHAKPKKPAFQEVSWVENRAFFFSRTANDSWHSYKGDGNNMRWVLIFNLMTNQLNKHEISDLGYVGFQLRRISDRTRKILGLNSRYA